VSTNASIDVREPRVSLSEQAQASVTSRLPASKWWPIWLLAVCIGLFNSGKIAEADIFWEVRAGLETLHGRVPRSDQYSFTVVNRHWQPNSWAWNVLLGLSWRVGRFVGIGVLSTVCITALVAGLGWWCVKQGASVVATLSCLVVVLSTQTIWLTPRPQLASYLLLLPLFELSREAMRRDSLLRYAGLVLLLEMLWTNLHLFGVIGVGVVGAATLGTVVVAPRQWIRAVALVASAAVGAALTPYGLAAYRSAFSVRARSVGLIDEWRHPNLNSTSGIVAVIALGLAAMCMTWSIRHARWPQVFLLGLLAGATISTVRFAPCLAVACVPEMAIALSVIRLGRVVAPAWRLGAFLVVAVLTAGAAQAATHLGQPDYAPQLTALIPSGCRVVTNDLNGGLTELLRPDVTVSLDTRNDLYGRTDLVALSELLNDKVPTNTDAWFNDHTVGCVFAPSKQSLVQRLSTDPNWRVAGVSDGQTLLVRSS
jgi:hypothetical protein